MQANKYIEIFEADGHIDMMFVHPSFNRKGFKVIASQIVEIRGQRLMNYRMEKYL
ncbi:MAG: hypothetical protein ABW174_14495 [Flavitalea sp.]